ncbi:MAG: hypothetical protein HY904_24785 [Deltaproteobacteria bacterium]|nr:hypothetical protein [Deltaproteobacteria bacterium]
MLSAAMLLGLGSAVWGQYPTTGASQVGALYSGGDNGRPKLNKGNCGSNTSRVSVDFQVITTVNPSFPQQPFGVLYWQDAPIPAPVVSTGSSGGYQQTLTSPVNCAEPVAEQVVTDNILLIPGQAAFPLSQYNPLVPTVSEFMDDLCRADGGVRTRRAYCFGVRNGQGGTTSVRGGDGPDIDTEPPAAPSGIRVEAGDLYALLTLGAPAGSDAVEAQAMQYQVESRECAPPDGGVPDAGELDAGTVDAGWGPCGPFERRGGSAHSPVRVGGLRNGVSYELRALAVDDFGNEGPVSSSVFVTPVKEYGLLDLYGGQVVGVSCQQGPALAWWLAGGVLAVALRRKARRRMGAET